MVAKFKKIIYNKKHIGGIIMADKAKTIDKVKDIIAKQLYTPDTYSAYIAVYDIQYGAFFVGDKCRYHYYGI